MAFPFYIARRYLFSKKSHHAINIISGVSVCGVAIATAALICILSVFNGFEDMVSGLFTSFDPQLKVLPAEGKFMVADADELEALRNDKDVAVYTETLEDAALLMMNNRQAMATVKGVDDNFEELTSIDNILIGDGVFDLGIDVIDYGIPGTGLLMQLGATEDFKTPLQVYAPREGEKIDLTDPTESFNQEELFSPGVAFQVKQNKYDNNYIITSIGFARRLFERQGYVSSIELRLVDGANIGTVKERIRAMMGPEYKVLDQYEQQEDTFKIMKIEKLISYIFLTFILMVACFNIIGSLSMLIIEKKDDASTLRNLGANDKQISSIFMLEGRMISAFGAVVGLGLGLLLCYLQQTYGLVKFGNSTGSYIIHSYPCSVHAIDILVVFATVIIVGFASVWYPVKSLTKKFAK
ncbi:MAG: FtsX-like permease family protein [Bacteroidaceae bacterium]|nr:FtsX-like permease family protein [Bacteroidaceae bacterium]